MSSHAGTMTRDVKMRGKRNFISNIVPTGLITAHGT